MRILMVTSEFVPLAKTGGLADMVAALSAELVRMGHDVRVVMPRYYGIDLRPLDPIKGPLGVPLGFGEVWAGVYETRMGTPEVPVYLLDHQGLFGRDGIYGSRKEPDFKDNTGRFTFLCRGAFQLCKSLGWIPEVIHGHDWPAALASVFLNTWEQTGPFEKTGSVLTIHNLATRGCTPKRIFISPNWIGSITTVQVSSSSASSTFSKPACAMPIFLRRSRRPTPVRFKR